MSTDRTLLPPADLVTDEGREAWANAVETVEHDGRDPSVLVEPLKRYARAADAAAVLRGKWRELGAPATELGGVTGRVVVAHPLVQSVGDAEARAARLWMELVYPPRRGQVGRPRGATSAPDRSGAAGAPPKMRVVGGQGA